MGFGEEKKDEMEKGKLFIGFWKELQCGTWTEEEWVVLLTNEIKKKKKKVNTTEVADYVVGGVMACDSPALTPW